MTSLGHSRLARIGAASIGAAALTVALIVALPGGCAHVFGPRPPHPSDFAALRSWRAPARPSPDGSVRFFVVGDWGHGNRGMREVAAAVARTAPRAGFTFGLTVGDNFYPIGVRANGDARWRHFYERHYGRVGLPIFATLGNHDWYNGEARAQWRYVGPSRTWQMPAPRYSFVVGDVRFIALDTTRWQASQARWLARLLLSVQERWVVVFGHHPIYSYGRHGDDDALITELDPLLRARVDFYIAGHDHDKQIIERRSRPIYVIDGAGATTRRVGRGRYTRFAKRTLGFLGVHISKDRARLRFYDVHGAVEHEQSYAARAAKRR